MKKILIKEDNGTLSGPYETIGTVMKETEVFVIFPREGTLWMAPARSVVVVPTFLERLVILYKRRKQVAVVQPVQPSEVVK